jgi:transcriptional regulator with XRE-family HTH domain
MARRREKPKNHLAEWRLFRQMTQQQLADEAGTTKSVISLLESGDRGLSDKWLQRLAPPLRTSPGFLMDHNPEDLPTDILDLWAEIPETHRAQARAVLETFRKKAS